MGVDPDQLLPGSRSSAHQTTHFAAPGSYEKPITLDDDDVELRQISELAPTDGRKRRAAVSVQDDGQVPTNQQKRRKSAKSAIVDVVGYGQDEAYSVSSKKRKAPAHVDEEKRLRRFRTHAPQSFKEVKERALTQRLCVLDRQRTGTPEQPSETIEIAGSTGNVYTVTIDQVPKCNCPHALKGNQCKHIVYVMIRTLKAPTDLSYQLALTTSELKQIFAVAPPLPSEIAESDGAGDGKRKPMDDDCPICYDSFNDRDKAVWCKDGCGNNMHAECFGKWANQSRATTGKVTCPFCRTTWQDADVKVGMGSETVNAEGYRNVASALGLSGRRDYSTYHSFWVRRQRHEGLIENDEDYEDDEHHEEY